MGKTSAASGADLGSYHGKLKRGAGLPDERICEHWLAVGFLSGAATEWEDLPFPSTILWKQGDRSYDGMCDSCGRIYISVSLVSVWPTTSFSRWWPSGKMDEKGSSFCGASGCSLDVRGHLCLCSLSATRYWLISVAHYGEIQVASERMVERGKLCPPRQLWCFILIANICFTLPQQKGAHQGLGPTVLLV